MNKQTAPIRTASFWLEDIPIYQPEIINILRKFGNMPELVKHIILERTLEKEKLEEEKVKEIMNDFKSRNNIQNTEDYNEFMDKRYLTEDLLIEIASRQYRLERYREKRWGSHARSIYLKNKNLYDKITYYRIQSNDYDMMQEIHFRLKDNEETWESLLKQMQKTDPKIESFLIKSSSLENVEPELLKELKETGEGEVIRPLRIDNGAVVVAELKEIETCTFNDEMRTLILQNEFEYWLNKQCASTLSKLRFKG